MEFVEQIKLSNFEVPKLYQILNSRCTCLHNAMELQSSSTDRPPNDHEQYADEFAIVNGLLNYIKKYISINGESDDESIEDANTTPPASDDVVEFWVNNESNTNPKARHARMGLFPQKSASNTQQQLSTDDLFSFGTPIPQPTTNSVVSKPLQSRGLHSSFPQFPDHFDGKDHPRISSKDHQWNPNDAKNQRRIDMAAGTMNTLGTTWSNSTTIPPNSMLQLPTLNNSFAVSNDPSEMNYTGMNNYLMDDNHDPFAVQSLMETQQQANGPFGGL